MKNQRATLLQLRHRYRANHQATVVAWAIMSIVYCVLNVVTFIQPQWIGDTPESPGFGHFGAYKYCYPDDITTEYVCSGSFSDLVSILNNSFRAVTVFSGLSAVVMLATTVSLIFFVCFRKGYVFILCGTLEMLSAVFMFLACVIYPSGWGHDEVKEICGQNAGDYRLGLCGIRWAYILAILGIFDAAILSVLAFFLAAKRAKSEVFATTGTVTKSELNGYSADTMSKKSIPIQPVVTVPDSHHERYSEYSQPMKRGANNFQL